MGEWVGEGEGKGRVRVYEAYEVKKKREIFSDVFYFAGKVIFFLYL
jgi:hypothetical protein